MANSQPHSSQLATSNHPRNNHHMLTRTKTSHLKPRLFQHLKLLNPTPTGKLSKILIGEKPWQLNIKLSFITTLGHLLLHQPTSILSGASECLNSNTSRTTVLIATRLGLLLKGFIRHKVWITLIHLVQLSRLLLFVLFLQLHYPSGGQFANWMSKMPSSMVILVNEFSCNSFPILKTPNTPFMCAT